MTWLSPAAAWWLLLLPALVALYISRPRSEKRVVSSLRLWQKLPQVDSPRARLRWPPLSLLLALQFILLAAGAIALIQPALAVPVGRHFVILLDASGSMMASDGPSPSAFEQAKSEARKIASDMTPQDRATLLRVGPSVTTACSNCGRSDLLHALDTLKVGGGSTNMTAALSLASGLEGRGADVSVQAFVISDGGFPAPPQEVLPPEVQFVQVGQALDNRAITTLSARRPPDGTPGYIAFSRVGNSGASQASLQVSAFADTVPLPPRTVTVQVGGHADFTWKVPAGTAKFTLSIASQDGSGDALPADDRSILFFPADGQYSVPISATQSAMYSRALAGLPGLRAVPYDGSNSPVGNVAFSIIQGKAPYTLPPGGVVLVNPGGPLVPSNGEMSNVRALPGTDHPIMSGVDLNALLVLSALRIEAVPSWLEAVVQSDQGTPLILAGERNGQRVVVLAFDPNDSNLPKLAAFPLLMANIVDWLSPVASANSLRPGDPIYLAPGSRVTGPSGSTVEVGASGLLADTEEPGVYSVVSPSHAQDQPPVVSSQFSVNMADAAESTISPRAHPELNRGSGQQGAQASRLEHQELWPPLAAAALVLVGAEWLFYCWRRGRL